MRLRPWHLAVLPLTAVVVVVAGRTLRGPAPGGGGRDNGGGGLGGVREPRRPNPSPPAMAAARPEPTDD